MRIKSLLLAIAMIVAVRSLAACSLRGGNGLKIEGSPAELDGVTVTLKKATARREMMPDRYGYAFSGTITNNTDEGIMKVTYGFSIRDKKGEEFRSFAIVYDGVDKAIPPHESVKFSHDDIKWGPQSVPASVEISIISVKTEAELPAAVTPKAGDALYLVTGDKKLANIKNEPPVELQFHIDQGGYGRTATLKEGPELDKAVSLLCDIRIAGETQEMVTDNYNWISLTWADGTSSHISLNLRSLELNIHSSPHLYTLENLGAFWNYASEFLEED